jgi:hypothetical protein
MTLFAAPVLAHPGSPDMHWHFLEHMLLLALMIGVPAVYLGTRLIKNRIKSD